VQKKSQKALQDVQPLLVLLSLYLNDTPSALQQCRPLKFLSLYPFLLFFRTELSLCLVPLPTYASPSSLLLHIPNNLTFVQQLNFQTCVPLKSLVPLLPLPVDVLVLASIPKEVQQVNQKKENHIPLLLSLSLLIQTKSRVNRF